MNLALKITPQRSTQYAHLTASLAVPELLASPLHAVIHEVQPITLAGQSYLLATVDDACLSDRTTVDVLYHLAAISEVYEYFERVGEVQGPLLHPVEPQSLSFVPQEMAETRRYKGKTNEIFTRVLLNIALFAGNYAECSTQRLRILDPLAGGGTILFVALARGYDAFGIEIERQDVETTAAFVRQYLKGEHIHFKEIDERGRKAGRRYQFEIGPKGNTRHLVLTHGDCHAANLHMRDIAGGPHVHAIVSDLPYGIQHFGEISDLLSRSLPIWEQMLFPGGTIALAWNATRIKRPEMAGLIQKQTQLQVLNNTPYTQFEHAVDRVIKRRDIIVAVKI
jgi:16S rRNA G966 N2-methylase RsmD